MKRTILLLALATLAACSQRVLTEPPAGDGYGPAGGAGGTTSSSGGSGTPSGSSSGSPSQPPPGDDGSGTSEEGGSTSPGLDAGAPEAGHPDAGAPDAGQAGDGSTSTDAGSLSSLLALCVSQINEVRNQNGASPYTESPDLEAYAAKAAASDANNGQKHGYFYATGGGGVATTEDELDGDQVDPGAGAQQTFEQGLQQDVQAQGQALANLVDTQFSEAGCGFAEDAAGNWWIDMALR